MKALCVIIMILNFILWVVAVCFLRQVSVVITCSVEVKDALLLLGRLLKGK